MGNMQTKVGLAFMLHKHKYEFSDCMDKNELKLSPQCIILTPAERIKVKVNKY